MVFKTDYENISESNAKFVSARGFNPKEGYIVTSGVCWFTNLDLAKSHEPLALTEEYHLHPERYPKYDNYDAIEVPKVSLIPKDYFGVMGVPITFCDKYCNEQFEVVGEFNHGSDCEFDLAKPTVNGKTCFKRIAIRRKK